MKFKLVFDNGITIEEVLGSMTNHAYLGVTAKFKFIYHEDLVDELLVREKFERKWFNVYYFNPANNDYIYIQKLYSIDVSVTKKTKSDYVVEVAARGIDAFLETMKLKLPRYWTGVDELLTLASYDAKNFLLNMFNDIACTTDCASVNGLILFTGSVANILLPGAGPLVIPQLLWVKPNDDVHKIQHLTLDLGDYGKVYFTREAFMNNAACIPQVGGNGTWVRGPCNVMTDPDVSTAYHKLETWLDPGYGLFFNWLWLENAPRHPPNAKENNFEFRTGISVMCCPHGCDISICNSPNTRLYKEPLTFPDLYLARNKEIRFVPIYPIDWDCYRGPGEGCRACSGTCKDDEDGCGVDIVCHASCWACRYAEWLKQHLLADIINPIDQTINSMFNIITDVLFGLINIVTWPVDIILRLISIVMTAYDFGNKINTCISRRLSKCAEFCEKWGKLLKYDIDRIIDFVNSQTGLNVAISGLSDEEKKFLLSGSEIDKPFEGSMLQILQAMALQTNKILRFGDTVEFVTVSNVPKTTLTFCDSNNRMSNIAYAKVESGEFGADMISVYSPILTLKGIKDELVQAIRSGKCSLECVPYRYAKLLKGKSRIIINGGGTRPLVVNIDEHPEIARAVLTHSSAVLVRIRVPIAPGSPFTNAITLKPGDTINVNVGNESKTFVVVDVTLNIGFIELLLVFKDSIASSEVELKLPRGLEGACA